MAERARATKAGNIGAGDATAAEIEQLSATRAAEAKAGHNSNAVPEETWRIHLDALKAKRSAIKAMVKQTSVLRQELSNAKDLAKKDKVDVKAIMRALDLEEAARENGSSGIVTEHRNVGFVLKLLDCPLGTQFSLFELPDTDKDGAKIDATLQGETAGLNGEPIDNCPYQPGTPDAFAWRNGHQIGAEKLTESFKTGEPPAPAGGTKH